VAGSWLTPEKRLRTEQEINLHNQLEGAELKITAGDLARTLMANGLVLIGDGERFKVIKVLMLGVHCFEIFSLWSLSE
jgi:hypothetical protein